MCAFRYTTAASRVISKLVLSTTHSVFALGQKSLEFRVESAGRLRLKNFMAPVFKVFKVSRVLKVLREARFLSYEQWAVSSGLVEKGKEG